MRKYLLAVASTVALTSGPTMAGAASLQVAPVSLEIPAPGASATIKLRNEGTKPLNAQIRVFRWIQVDGEEKLEATDDVVASPPLATLAAKTDYVVRLVRTTKRDIAKGESYRLLVDELPDPSRQQNGVVAIVLRYSIPVFFYPVDTAAPKLTWSVAQSGGRVFVSATNEGGRHVRLANLKLRAPNGADITFGNGLSGYVLGHSTMRWAANNNKNPLGAGNPVAITAQSDSGPVSASPTLPSNR